MLSRLLGGDRRMRRLRAWGKTVPVTPAQSAAMAALLKASRAQAPPVSDPLVDLGPDDREYLKRICSADFRPSKFGNSDVARGSVYSQAVQRGFTPEQAVIIVGMLFNRVGPTD